MSLPDEELLSAYVDGELSADERSRVERLLADSPESRQLLDELHSIRASLQRMPRARLGHDFADQVLRQAEKELLTTTEGSEGVHAQPATTDPVARRPEPAIAATSETAERVERLSGLSWQRARRPAICAALALAAGLLIMFLNPQRGPKLGRQVAMGPGAVQERDGGEIGARNETALADPQNRASGASTAPQSEASPQPEFSAAGATAAPAGRPLPTAEDPPPPASKEANRTLSGMSGGRAMSPAVGKPAQADSDKDSRRGLMERPGRDYDQVADETRDSPAASNNPLVVWCDVAPGTNYSESFRELLAEQNIRWEAEAEAAETETLLGLQLEGKFAKKRAAADGAPEREVALEEQDRKKRPADTERAVLDADAEVVLVEASQPQIEAVLAAIDGAAQVFVNVDVEPPPEAPQQQQQLQRFARGQILSEKAGERLDEATKQAAVEELQKREDPAKAPKAKQAAGAAGGSESAAGTARRLTVHAAAPSDETAKSDEQKDEALPQRVQSRDGKEGKVKLRQLSKTPLSFGLAGPGQGESKDHFQVLFILRPMEATGPTAAAKPSDDND